MSGAGKPPGGGKTRAAPRAGAAPGKSAAAKLVSAKPVSAKPAAAKPVPAKPAPAKSSPAKSSPAKSSPAEPAATGGREPFPAKPCPICGKPSVERYHPFCSRRCADVDLNRWLSGAYAIPGRAEEDEDGEGPGGEER